MRLRLSVCVLAFAARVCAPSAVQAATIAVPAGGDLQAALDLAQPGDVIALAPGATYVGNFTLPNKGAIAEFITVRSAAPDAALPGAGVRMTPAWAAQLPKIRSGNSTSALRTAAGANHWKLTFLEFQANAAGAGDIIALGAGDATQTQLSQVPYALVIDRVYVHGDPVLGQKRGISLHSRDTDILNSWVSDCKAVGQEAQAISGFNGPGGYDIENNYLEGATQSFLLGGADPTIPDLVTSSVTFRYNHLSKPLAWRDPIVAAPAGVSAAFVPGAGSLGAGTYAYRVAARRKSGQNSLATSPASIEASVTIAAGTTGGVTIAWTPVDGAEEYLVYGRTPGGQTMYWKTTNTVVSDGGAIGISVGTPSTVETPRYAGTKWIVKNIFELKNARDVLVEGNVFENLWVADQPGYPIVFTPRNQGGSAPWVAVQNVTFRYNIVRHTAGGVNILGTDNVAPSQRTHDITISDNVFDDLSSATWGSGARSFQIGDGPIATTIDHNTVVTTDSTIVGFYGAPAMSFRYTNNTSLHNAYGINGSGSSSGLTAITAYAPDAVVCNDILAGGAASRYPACDYFPTSAEWIAGFSDYAHGDYHLLPAFAARYASTDGHDLGAAIDTVNTMTVIALDGAVPQPDAVPPGGNVKIVTTELSYGVVGQQYGDFLECSGGSQPCAWRLADTSRLPAGIAFDPRGSFSGVPTAAGTGSATVVAFDPAYPSNSATKTFTIDIRPAPLALQYSAVREGIIGVPFQAAPAVTNGVAPLTFWLAGVLPNGLTLDPATGVIAGVPTSRVELTVAVHVSDATGATTSAGVTIVVASTAVVVDPSPLPAGREKTAYAASLHATGGWSTFYTWFVDRGALPPGLALDASTGAVSGVPTAAGTFSFGVSAFDGNGGSARADTSLTIQPAAPSAADVVLYAADANVIKGTWSIVADATAAGGHRLANPDASAPKVAAPLAAPANYFELTFQAQAGVPYHLWMRGKAAGNYWGNDSVYVQFSGSVSASGAPIDRIGSTSGAAVTIEEASGTGLSGWGWADDAYGGFGSQIYFDTTGPQTIRVQVREDGLSLDQIVLGAARYASVAPGAAKNDATILARAGGAFRTVVLYAADAATAGTWSVVADSTAAGGRRLANPDASAPKLAAPLAAPRNYFELTFAAEAGIGYHLWMRGKAQNDYWGNDSVYVQFSGSVNASGAAINRIGSIAAATVSIEDASGAGLSGWGWADDAYGGLAAPMYFAATGSQTIRVQVREDGLSIDQIVLSADRFLAVAPGAARDDTTIVPR